MALDELVKNDELVSAHAAVKLSSQNLVFIAAERSNDQHLMSHRA